MSKRAQEIYMRVERFAVTPRRKGSIVGAPLEFLMNIKNPDPITYLEIIQRGIDWSVLPRKTTNRHRALHHNPPRGAAPAEYENY